MEFAVISKPIKSITLSVEQIVAVRSMLKLELVAKLNDLLKVGMFIAINGKHKLADLIGDTSQEVMALVDRFDCLDRPFVSALGVPYEGDFLNKYRLDKQFTIRFIESDFRGVAEIVEKGTYIDYIEYSVENEAEEESFHSFIPTVLMMRNKDELIRLFNDRPQTKAPVVEVGAYSMPMPQGNFKN